MICANKVANETKIIDRTKIVFDDNRDNIALESYGKADRSTEGR